MMHYPMGFAPYFIVFRITGSFGKKCTWILKKGRSMYKIYDLIIIAIQDFMR